MSDAPAAPVTEQGVPPATQTEEVPSFKVFIGNLAYSTTDQGLKAFFEPVQSDIISAQVIMRGNRSAGYGFVALSTAEAAQKAVEVLDKKQLDNRPIIVEIARPADQKESERRDRKPRNRRPGRRGSRAVPGEVTEAEANGEAKAEEDTTPAEGEAPKPKKKKKKSTKKTKARSSTADGEAEPAVTTSEGESGRRRRTPRPRRAVGEEPTGEPSKSVLFVANLGFNIDDVALAVMFTEAGINVLSARIVRRPYGRPRRSKGYGFVDVGDEAEQKKAIEALEGKEVGGRTIAVKVAVNAQAREAKVEAVAEDDTPEVAIVAAQLELDSREEGLSKSLFERAEDDKASGRGTENKALSMMMKMGFKPGQALGVPANVDVDEGSTPIGTSQPIPRDFGHPTADTRGRAGRKGIGLGKRAPSPTELERLAKVARDTEETNKESFRDRSRREYEQRRVEARLGPAQRTCVTLDERAGMEVNTERHHTIRPFPSPYPRSSHLSKEKKKWLSANVVVPQFNALWLDPINPDTFPAGLLDAVAASTAAATAATAAATAAPPAWSDKGEERSIEERLREQMRADALQPLGNDDDDDDDGDGDGVASSPKNADFSSESDLPPKWIEDAAQFLGLKPAERLDRILQYLRAEYHYCFWCGTEYKTSDEMQEECPGPEEDMHD
ncbi:RNA-binding domain containing protein [Russula decolorans]